MSFYVADRGNPSASGLVAAAGFLPAALLSPVAGAWADRFSRRRIIVIANSISMVIAASVATLVGSGRATTGWLALLSFAAGCAGQIGFPAFQATLPDLVPREELVAAIGLSSMQWNLGRIVGPTAAGVAIAIGGVPAALWVNTASFAAVIATVSLASIPRRPGVRRSVLAAARDAVAFARRNRAPRAMVPLMVVQVLIASPFIGFIAQMATNVFHHGQSGTSLLVTAQGVGAVATGVAIGSMSARFGLRWVLVSAIAVSGPALVLYGAAPNIWIGAVGVMVLGACYMAVLSSCTSITQQAAPAALRGRAMAVNNFVVGSCYPLGVLVQGVIADRTSLRAVTIGSGVLLAVVLAAMLLRRPARLADIASIDAPDGREAADGQDAAARGRGAAEGAGAPHRPGPARKPAVS